MKVSFNRVFIEYSITDLWEKLREWRRNENWALARRSWHSKGDPRDMEKSDTYFGNLPLVERVCYHQEMGFSYSFGH